ncbi:MAG: sensor histidine kinase [Desulfuromonadaceae bacterium]
MVHTIQEPSKYEIVRIVAIYALFGALWIYLSDTFIGFVISDPVIISRISIYKGIVFIALTASLLYVLIARYIKRISTHIIEFRTLADSGQALIWKAGTDKLCNYFNKVWLNFTGRTYEQEAGNGWTEGVHPDDFRRCVDIYLSAFDKRETFSMDYRLRRHDGEYRWIQDDGCPRYDMDGNFLGYIGYCLDITERKQAEHELQDKNGELERFTYTVSHDLKSPLITIQSYVGMIRKDLDTGNYARAEGDLNRIERAAAKMNDLLNGLLELSRIGRMMSEASLIDMSRLVDNCLAQLAGPLKEKRVKVVLQPDLPATLGDPQRMSSMLQNLIENAIKYMGDQAAPCIEIGTREEGRETVFFVSDNGVGIEPRHNEKVFGLFDKLDAKSSGTGIGLALVKRVIEVHGGRVWVESEGDGKGSRFCFTLPAPYSRSTADTAEAEKV